MASELQQDAAQLAKCRVLPRQRWVRAVPWRRPGRPLDRLVQAVRAGQSRGLMAHGEPGAGTTLIEATSGAAILR